MRHAERPSCPWVGWEAQLAPLKRPIAGITSTNRFR